MKKRGYTLIELIAVMAILAILLGSGFTIVGVLRHLKAEVEFENVAVEISNILSYGKAYCRKNEMDGQIAIDTSKRQIRFRVATRIIKIVQFPDDVDVVIRAGNADPIDIDPEGYLKKACSIDVTNGKKVKVITISVGNDKVTVKPEQNLVSEIEESE